MSSQKRVLLIDDDPEYLECLEAFLQPYSDVLKVDTASTFVQGQDAIKRNEHDIYVADYRLDNEHTGLEYIEDTSTNLRPLVVITSNEDTDVGDYAIREGACDFILKQELSGSRLHRVLRNSLARRQRMTEIVKRQEELSHKISTDPLTGLVSRAMLCERIEEKLADENHLGALFYIDLDGFKPVNDRYGHALGDRVLQVVAQRMIKSVRSDDIVGRLGGDEFLAHCSLPKDLEDAESVMVQIAEKLLSVLSKAYKVKSEALGQTVRIQISASIGIIRTPQRSMNYHQLRHQADMAMYRAKALGRNQYCFYQEEFSDEHSNVAS